MLCKCLDMYEWIDKKPKQNKFHSLSCFVFRATFAQNYKFVGKEKTHSSRINVADCLILCESVILS